jgi:23S rRNA (guanosine2251-2'-O)-methyltransferase
VIVYGRNAVREAIRGPREVRRVWATEAAARSVSSQLTDLSISLEGAQELVRLCGSEEHQGICADVSEFRYADGAALLALERPLLVALDQVQDPQNLGSICRVCECAGVDGMVIPERRAAEVTAAVCKASAGAVEWMAIARIRNLADWLGEAKQAGLWCYGADASAPAAYDGLDYSGGTVLVLGSEGRGLRPRVASACDALVSIPLRGKVESLSVATAAAVLVYEASRGRSR